MVGAVPGFPEYDEGPFAFGFARLDVEPGERGTVIMSPTCDNIIFSRIKRIFLPDSIAGALHVEYILVSHWRDFARELVSDLPGRDFAISTNNRVPQYVCHANDVLVATLKNTSAKPVRVMMGVEGVAYHASRESELALGGHAALHKRRMELLDYITADLPKEAYRRK